VEYKLHDPAQGIMMWGGGDVNESKKSLERVGKEK